MNACGASVIAVDTVSSGRPIGCYTEFTHMIRSAAQTTCVGVSTVQLGTTVDTRLLVFGSFLMHINGSSDGVSCDNPGDVTSSYCMQVLLPSNL